MHSFADRRGQHHRFGEVRVVAEIFRGVRQRELEPRQVAALEHLADDHLEHAGIDGAGRNHFMQLANRQSGFRRRRARFGGRGANRLCDEVIDELQDDPVTGGAGMDDVLAECGKYRF